jgi:hypothetical protein
MLPDVTLCPRPGLYELRGYTNFYEKALFVKVDVAAPCVVAWRNRSLPFALCFYPHS